MVSNTNWQCLALGLLIAMAGGTYIFCKENKGRIMPKNKMLCVSLGLDCAAGALFSYYVENKCRVGEIKFKIYGANSVSSICKNTGNLFSKLGNSWSLAIPLLVSFDSILFINSRNKSQLNANKNQLKVSKL